MESRVREIFSKHLAASNDINEAATESYRELSEEALACAYEGRVVDKPVWDLLIKIIRALARVKLYSVYYDNYPNIDAVEFGPRILTMFTCSSRHGEMSSSSSLNITTSSCLNA